jgi:L-2-hydroxyglutarate oxidase
MATSREGYKFTNLNIRDVYEAVTFIGFQKLFVNYWQTGIGELYRSLNRAAYVKLLQEFVPEIKLTSLEGDKAAGVRALALSEEGALVDDLYVKYQF